MRHGRADEVLSGRLAAYVKWRTGAPRADLVAHSFGSLVTRVTVPDGTDHGFCTEVLPDGAALRERRP